MEYGWGACLDHVDEDDPDRTYPPVQVFEWQPPVPPTVSSATEEKAQLDALHKHVQELNETLDRHRDLKRKLELRVCVAWQRVRLCLFSKKLISFFRSFH